MVGMALSLSSMLTNPSSLCSTNSIHSRIISSSSSSSNSSISIVRRQRGTCGFVNNNVKCESQEELGGEVESSVKRGSTKKKLGIGSPIIVVEAPLFLKTAASVPCLRANSGLVKPGDVGRIMSRKPKDVWAIRLSIGTYLIDGKYFQPLELDE